MKLTNPFKRRSTAGPEASKDLETDKNTGSQESEPHSEASKMSFMDIMASLGDLVLGIPKWFDSLMFKFDGKPIATQWLDYRYKRVGLYEFDFDEELGVYREDYTHIPKDEKPIEAVHVTGTSKDWFIDRTGLARFPEERELTAVYAELWRQNHYISDAFTDKWHTPMDWKKLLAVVGIGIVAILILESMMA